MSALASMTPTAAVLRNACPRPAANGSSQPPAPVAKLVCLKCGEAGQLAVPLDGTRPRIHCLACDEDLALAEVEQHLTAWVQLVTWISSKPE